MHAGVHVVRPVFRALHLHPATRPWKSRARERRLAPSLRSKEREVDACHQPRLA